MKIVIIGYSGSGKSTLAHYLGKKYKSNVLYLDKVHWLPNWQERNREEELELVEHFLDSNDSWVIDGNYTKLLYERRIKEADKIIFMNFNRFTCLYRAIKRYFLYKGKTRESMTSGCEEKIDLEFAWWILYEGRNKKYRQSYQDILNTYSEKIIYIKNQKQLDFFMRKIARKRLFYHISSIK